MDYDMFVDFNGQPKDPNVAALLNDLRASAKEVHILASKKVPWFPMRLKDLDRVANDVLQGGTDLQADHPGFTDEVYKASRKRIAEISSNFKMGDPVPRVNYTPEEIQTWGTVYKKLKPLLKAHGTSKSFLLDSTVYSTELDSNFSTLNYVILYSNSPNPLYLMTPGCREHVNLLPLLEENCGYSEDSIPQLQDISVFLKDSTGFLLR